MALHSAVGVEICRICASHKTETKQKIKVVECAVKILYKKGFYVNTEMKKCRLNNGIGR